MKTQKKKSLVLGILLVSALFLSINLIFADPTGPSSITYNSNETKTTDSAIMVNISGGYIADIDITAEVQNTKWKALIGNVNGKFTLEDASGSTIYDWSLSVTSGRVYATRNSSTIQWSSIACSSTANLESENTALSHSSISDNITKTFNDTTHGTFWVGSTNIVANSCPTLNTYVNNASQDTDFEEMALYDGASIVYATIMEDNEVGYDGGSYDFQMLIPENGSSGFSGATAYYMYVELN